MDSINALSEEQRLYLCSFLPLRDLASLGVTCKKLNAFVKDQTLWRPHAIQLGLQDDSIKGRDPRQLVINTFESLKC